MPVTMHHHFKLFAFFLMTVVFSHILLAFQNEEDSYAEVEEQCKTCLKRKVPQAYYIYAVPLPIKTIIFFSLPSLKITPSLSRP